MEDLTEIIQELTAVAAYWFTVGVFLKVPYDTLESIKKNHHAESNECLREMLATWLRERERSITDSVGTSSEISWQYFAC